MTHELTLALATPIEDLVPKMIAFNNTELLAAVEEMLSAYDGVVYDDEHISDAKQDRSTLNTFSKALNDERIRIGKLYNSPYEKFKAQVDEVIDRVKVASAKIDEQVKAYEDKKRAEKQDEIIEYFKSVIGEFSGCIPYERVHQSKWLNASTTMKSVKAEIDAIITNAKSALIAISALGSQDEELIKAFYFRTLDLSAALNENNRLKKEREAAAELKARQEAAQPAAVEVKAETPAQSPKLQTVKFAVTGTVEQLKALQHYLRENKLDYKPIREE